MAHKCFISFKTEDLPYKKYIQEKLNIDMVDKSLDEPIDSNDEEYIMRRIREDYLSDSTVTIHLIGDKSAENLGEYEQRFIKRELQASLYNGENNPRSGILGVVLPTVHDRIFRGTYPCNTCGGNHSHIAISDSSTVKEFSYNYYIPNNKCCHPEEDRYCILVSWENFIKDPEQYIDLAFEKRASPIAEKVRVYGGV